MASAIDELACEKRACGRVTAKHFESIVIILVSSRPRPHEERERERERGRERERARSVHRIAYSINSSARASSMGGMVMPSALAVLRLITSSNLVGAWTGKSPGFTPFRIRST